MWHVSRGHFDLLTVPAGALSQRWLVFGCGTTPQVRLVPVSSSAWCSSISQLIPYGGGVGGVAGGGQSHPDVNLSRELGESHQPL